MDAADGDRDFQVDALIPAAVLPLDQIWKRAEIVGKTILFHPKGKSKELIIIKEIYRANFPLSHSILHI